MNIVQIEYCLKGVKKDIIDEFQQELLEYHCDRKENLKYLLRHCAKRLVEAKTEILENFEENKIELERVSNNNHNRLIDSLEKSIAGLREIRKGIMKECEEELINLGQNIEREIDELEKDLIIFKDTMDVIIYLKEDMIRLEKALKTTRKMMESLEKEITEETNEMLVAFEKHERTSIEQMTATWIKQASEIMGYDIGGKIMKPEEMERLAKENTLLKLENAQLKNTVENEKIKAKLVQIEHEKIIRENDVLELLSSSDIYVNGRFPVDAKLNTLQDDFNKIETYAEKYYLDDKYDKFRGILTVISKGIDDAKYEL